MKRCPVCGAKIEDGLETCPYCGEIVSSGRSRGAWAELADTRDRQAKPVTKAVHVEEETDPKRQIFYNDPTEAQQPSGPKKKSKVGLVSAILIAVFVGAVALYLITGGIGGGIGGEGEDPYIIAEDFCGAVIDDAILLEDIGVDMANYRYDALENAAYDGDEEAAKDAVWELHKDDIDTVGDNYDNISSLYDKAMKQAEKAGETELADAINDVYGKYLAFYLTALTFDSSYEEYVDAFSAADDDLYYAIEKLAGLLGLV
ncbi:MAG: zinc ribbon domain-containing protein [Clostridia bacterium]|nr:zinc ribbon domain-containing protein [Clostridia bacterium]